MTTQHTVESLMATFELCRVNRASIFDAEFKTALTEVFDALAEAKADADCRHTLLKLQHAESVELWNALKDLSFECDGVTCVVPPSRATYNRTFGVLQSKRHLSPEALRGYGSSGMEEQK